MKLSLDTHTLLWWLADRKQLSAQAIAALHNRGNVVYVSAVVAWEIAIKASSGKLPSLRNLEGLLRINGFLGLPVSLAHAAAVEHLPFHHRDPFDRLLVAQAICDGLTIVTRDPFIPLYAAACLVA